MERLCFATTPPDVNKIQEFMNRIYPLQRWGDLQKLPDLKMSLSGPSSIAAVEVRLGLPPNYLKALLLKTGITHIENPDSLIMRRHLVSILRSVGIQVN